MDHHKAIVKVAELDKKGPFAQFLINAKTRPECMGLDFLALLITPVQRILRYKLLLEDLIKHTPNDHPDHVDLVMVRFSKPKYQKAEIIIYRLLAPS